MVEKLVNILKTARPRQWVKNLTLYAALIFTGYLYTSSVFWKDFEIVTKAVLAFTLVASAIYFINDLVDIKADQLHPFKKKRPIAAEKVSKIEAVIMAILLATVGLVWSAGLSGLFFTSVLVYLGLQILYSVWLKNIEVIDVFVIALGFFLRVLAGALVINAHLSIWFILCVISVSLFLAVGKRRAEMAILTEQGMVQHRKVMGKYTPDILDAYLSMFATASWLSWALFTFNFYEQMSPEVVSPISLGIISKTLTINKWLMASIPVVVFGIMRYLRVIYDGSRAETPERVILSDYPLLTTVAVWGLIVVAVLYL
jgi:4-hydroxybenzoate polyprenyltransferase